MFNYKKEELEKLTKEELIAILSNSETMKIKEIDSKGIHFSNGSCLSYYHQQDCCENVYADFENLQVLTKINSNSINSDDLIFDTNILSKIEKLNDVGFTIEDNNGIKLFVSCYNRQSGYYSSELELVYSTANGLTSNLDISDCVRDDIV